VRTRLRWGPDVVVPLLLLLVVLFAPPPPMRILAAGLLAIRALAVAYLLIVRAGVTARRGEPLVHANRYTPFTCTLTVRNRTPLPIHFLTVADRIGSFAARQPAQFVVGLGPWEERSFSYELEGRERGEYQLGPVDLVGTDAFGFFPWRAQVSCYQRVIVYPNIYALDLHHKRGLPSGSLKVLNKLYEDVTRYRSLREYQPGDEPKRINWKASARMGALFSMEYVPSIYFPVLVLLNLTADDYPLVQRAHLVERAIEAAASLVFYFVGIGQEVGLVTTGRIGQTTGGDTAEAAAADDDSGAIAGAAYTVEPVRAGYAHAAHLLEQLARVSAVAGEQAANFVDVVQRGGVSVASGTRVAVVTPPLKEQQRAGLLALRRRGYDVEVFLVSTHQARREDLAVEGLTSHTVGGYGRELVRG
jgi:uncharacterized protein (DUF58 family)